MIGLIFFVMLCFTIWNIYSYLWKQVGLRSYPIVISYILLVLFSAVGMIYEFFMGFRCGKHDCFTHLLVSMMPEYRVFFLTERH